MWLDFSSRLWCDDNSGCAKNLKYKWMNLRRVKIQMCDKQRRLSYHKVDVKLTNVETREWVRQLKQKM